MQERLRELRQFGGGCGLVGSALAAIAVALRPHHATSSPLFIFAVVLLGIAGFAYLVPAVWWMVHSFIPENVPRARLSFGISTYRGMYAEDGTTIENPDAWAIGIRVNVQNEDLPAGALLNVLFPQSVMPIKDSTDAAKIFPQHSGILDETGTPMPAMIAAVVTDRVLPVNRTQVFVFSCKLEEGVTYPLEVKVVDKGVEGGFAYCRFMLIPGEGAGYLGAPGELGGG